jgi:serine/threonine protein kinase
MPSHSVQVSICRNEDAQGFIRLKITPVCSSRCPISVVELKKAIQSVLLGLLVLHDHGFIHRDIRWPNVLCDAHDNWLLSDFELSSPIGHSLPAQFLNNSHFSPEVRLGDGCTTALDIWQVGKLVEIWDNGSALREASAFVQALSCDDPGSRISIRDALLHPWLSS